MAQKVRGTSIDCYYGNIKNKSENKQFRLILDCLIEKGSATRGEIAHYLKMEKSTVAARVNAMLKYGILQEVGKRKFSSPDRREPTWRPKEVPLWYSGNEFKNP